MVSRMSERAYRNPNRSVQKMQISPEHLKGKKCLQKGNFEIFQRA